MRAPSGLNVSVPTPLWVPSYCCDEPSRGGVPHTGCLVIGSSYHAGPVGTERYLENRSLVASER